MYKYLHCPKCEKPRSCIRHGKILLRREGNPIQRIRCKSCGKTSIVKYQHSFFDRMHTDPNHFYKAMLLYSNGTTIKDIASQLKTRPNSVIDWIRRVQKYRNLYISYLRTFRHYTFPQIAEFFKGFSYLSKKKRTKQLKQYQNKPLVKQSSASEPS